MKSIQADYQSSPEWQEITTKAYPETVPVKKEKKVKDKGSRYPGAANANANANANAK